MPQNLPHLEEIRPMRKALGRKRPVIAFFDYPDVFEDFYPHYAVDQQEFAARWAGSGSHAFVSLIQREVGDVIWYEFSVAPQIREVRHERGFLVKFLPSSRLHRWLWRVFYLPSPAWRWRRVYPLYATVASYVTLASLPFIKALRQDRPDMFFAQDYATGRFDMLVLIAWILRVPLIAFHSGSRPEQYIGKFAKRWTIPRADCLIVSSHVELEMLACQYAVPRDRLRLILTPIDTIRFRPMARDVACSQAGLDPHRRYFLFVGRLDNRVKRVDSLIRAFADVMKENRDLILLIVGDGPDGQSLRAQAAQAPDRVRFLGWISNTDSLACLYNTAEWLILPSWTEGFPTVVGEAMACGTPVVASQVGGVGELVVDGETGWLLPPGDDDALKARLFFIAAHPQLGVPMRPQARKMAEARVSATVVSGALKNCFLDAKQEHVG